MDLDRFFTRLNPLFVGLLRAPILHWTQSRFLILLTITGRKSGKTYTIPVGYQRYDDKLVTLVSKAKRKNWWRNFREPWPVEILYRRTTIRTEGRLLARDSDEFRDYAAETFRRLPWLGFQFEIDYDKNVGLTDEQIKVLGEHARIVEFTLPSESL